MRKLSVRNVVFVLMVGASLLAAKSASAQEFWCYNCQVGGWGGVWCDQVDYYDRDGREICIDQNQGWTNCSLSGGYCQIVYPN